MRKKCSQLRLKQLLRSLSCSPNYPRTKYLNIIMHANAWTNCQMLEVIKYNRRGRRWRFDCNTIQLRNVYSQKFHTNRNIANNIKFKIAESSGVLRCYERLKRKNTTYLHFLSYRRLNVNKMNSQIWGSDLQWFLSEKHFHFKFPALSITGQYVKCRLQNDWGLLFVGLENSGNTVVTCSFARWKQ